MMLAKKYSSQEVCQVLSFPCIIYHFEPLERKLIYSIICVMLLISFTYSQSNILSDFLPLITLRAGSSGAVLFPTSSLLPKGTEGGGVSGTRSHFFGAEIVYGRTNNLETGFFYYGAKERSIGGMALKQRLGEKVSAGLSLFQGKIRGVKGFIVTSFSPKKSFSFHLGCGVLFWKYENLKRQELLPYISLIWEVSNRWRLAAGVQDRRDFANKPSYFLSIHSQLNHQFQLGLGIVQSGFSKRPLLFASFGIDEDIFARP